MKNNKNDYFHNERNSLAGAGFYDMYLKTERSGSLVERKILTSMNNPIHRLNVSDKASSRNITHWQNVGLINDKREKGKGWRSISFTEIIWIHVIIKLRDFGLDLERIKNVKKFLERYKTENHPSEYPELDYYMSCVINDETPVKLLVFDSGEALLGNQEEINISLQFSTIQDDYISIDLNKLVNKIFNDEILKTNYLDHSLTPIEKEIKEALSLENLLSLSLKIKSGDEYLFDKELILSSEKEMNVLLNKLNFAEATTIKRGGKMSHILTDKKKISKY